MSRLNDDGRETKAVYMTHAGKELLNEQREQKKLQQLQAANNDFRMTNLNSFIKNDLKPDVPNKLLNTASQFNQARFQATFNQQ